MWAEVCDWCHGARGGRRLWGQPCKVSAVWPVPCGYIRARWLAMWNRRWAENMTLNIFTCLLSSKASTWNTCSQMQVLYVSVYDYYGLRWLTKAVPVGWILLASRRYMCSLFSIWKAHQWKCPWKMDFRAEVKQHCSPGTCCKAPFTRCQCVRCRKLVILPKLLCSYQNTSVLITVFMFISEHTIPKRLLMFLWCLNKKELDFPTPTRHQDSIDLDWNAQNCSIWL